MDRYEILKFIARGSFGSVYKVLRKYDNKILALKKINYKFSSNYEKESIINEIKLLTFHNCPYLLKARDIFLEKDNICIVTSFAENHDLKNIIKKNKIFSENEVWKIFTQLIIALDYLHDYQVIHRDLKTANIMLSRNYNIYLGDFGVAKILPPTQIHTKTQIGTPYYFSPEIVDGKNYTNSTDVWSLGCILYELIYNKLPFEAQNMYQLAYKIKNQTIHYPHTDFSSKLVTLLKSMLSKNKYNRPSINKIKENPNIKEWLNYFNYTKYKYSVERENYLQKTYSINNWNNLILQLNENRRTMKKNIALNETFTKNKQLPEDELDTEKSFKRKINLPPLKIPTPTSSYSKIYPVNNFYRSKEKKLYNNDEKKENPYQKKSIFKEKDKKENKDLDNNKYYYRRGIKYSNDNNLKYNFPQIPVNRYY